MYKKFLLFLFPGPKRVRRIKAWVVFGLLILSFFSIWAHMKTIQNAILERNKIKYPEIDLLGSSFLSVFEEIGVNLLVGIFTFIALDIAFHSVEKWFGRRSDFSYNSLSNDIKQSGNKSQIKMLSIFFRVFSPPKKNDFNSEVEFDDAYVKFLNERSEFIDAVYKACTDRTTKVDILLLDPNTLSAKHRKQEIIDAKLNLNIIEEIIRTLNAVIEIRSKLPKSNKNLSIKLYDRLPPFSLFKVNDEYSFAFYPRDKTMRDAEHWSFYEGSQFEKFILNTFDEIWKHATSFDLEFYVHTNLYSFSHPENIAIGKIHYIDVQNPREGIYPDEKIFMLYPTQLQMVEVQKCINEHTNKIYIDYRNKKMECDVVPMVSMLSEFKFSDKENALEILNDLANDKYPATQGIELRRELFKYFIKVINL